MTQLGLKIGRERALACRNPRPGVSLLTYRSDRDVVLRGGQECNLAPNLHWFDIGGRQSERAQIVRMCEKRSVDGFDKLIRPGQLIAAVAMHHAQIESATTLEATMLPPTELP